MTDAGLKQRLDSALHAAVRGFNDGDDPDTAVYKAAELHDFNAEQAKRLCEAFNTARTLAHFDKHPDDKAAEFQLCEPDNVVAKLYDAGDSKAADVQLHDYSEYSLRPCDDLTLDVPVRKDYVPIDKQAHLLERKLRDTHAQAFAARESASTARHVARKAAAALADEIRDDYDRSGPDRFTRFSLLSDPVDAIIPVPHLPERVRVAATKQAFYRPLRDVAGVEGWIKSAHDISELFASARALDAMADDLDKSAEAVRAEFGAIIGSEREQDWFEQLMDKSAYTAPEKYPAKPAPAGGGTGAGGAGAKGVAAGKSKKRDWSDLDLFGFGSELRGPVGGIVDTATKDYTSEALKMLGNERERDNKNMSERLRQHQREILLTELLMSDPVISEADPENVLAGYQTIVDFAPDVSLNSSVVRAMLRHMVHSDSFSAFDAQALAQLEKTHKEVHGRLPGRPA